MFKLNISYVYCVILVRLSFAASMYVIIYKKLVMLSAENLWLDCTPDCFTFTRRIAGSLNFPELRRFVTWKELWYLHLIDTTLLVSWEVVGNEQRTKCRIIRTINFKNYLHRFGRMNSKMWRLNLRNARPSLSFIGFSS